MSWISGDVMEALEAAWRRCPELRLGQLLLNVAPEDQLYYISDFELMDRLRSYPTGIVIDLPEGEHELKLKGGDSMILTIKALRQVLGLGLIEVKNLWCSLPCVVYIGAWERCKAYEKQICGIVVSNGGKAPLLEIVKVP